jgi:hypothetical protein
MVIAGYKYPDVNFDGKVDYTDLKLINAGYGKTKSDPNWSIYEQYDLNFDGKIDGEDLWIGCIYFGTVTFSSKPTTSYMYGANVTFTFSAVSIGGPSVVKGTFRTLDYQLLKGIWTINSVVVNSSSAINLDSYKAVVIFNCTDSTVNPNSVTVTAQIADAKYTLSYNGSNVWLKELSFSRGINSLMLEASTPDKINRIVVTVITPEQPKFTIGHGLIISGMLLAIGGIIIIRKKHEEIY